MIYIGMLPRGQRGFSLVEILAAMALLCIGLLALFGAFGATIISNVYAAERADAVRIAQEQLESVKGMPFADVTSQSGQVNRNGIFYTYELTVSEREANPYLKDVAITVSWMSRRVSPDVAERVQFATAVLRR